MTDVNLYSQKDEAADEPPETSRTSTFRLLLSCRPIVQSINQPPLLSRVVASGLVNQRQIFVCRGQKRGEATKKQWQCVALSLLARAASGASEVYYERQH
jgi:hypothetical protein